MNRYTVHAPQHVPKVSLNTYVHRAFPLLTDSAIRNAFQARDVKMNGMRCSKDQLIEPGAEVTVFTPCKMDIPIVCENEEIIALDKPAGVSCDADSYGSMTVQDWAVLNAKGSCQPRLCHRLDNATSGIVLLAKNEAVETALLDMFAEHRIQKTYCCLVKGCPDQRKAKKTAWLYKDAKRANVQIYDWEKLGAKQIITEYEVLQGGKVSLLKVRLHTGRTHQIRAHLAHLGYPLLGDDLYGDREFNKKWGNGKLMLRSVELELDADARIPISSGLKLTVPIKIDQSIP